MLCLFCLCFLFVGFSGLGVVVCGYLFCVCFVFGDFSLISVWSWVFVCLFLVCNVVFVFLCLMIFPGLVKYVLLFIFVTFNVSDVCCYYSCLF